MIRLLKRIWCWITKHKFYISRPLTPHVYQVTCNKCGIILACNDHVCPGWGLPWDEEFEKLFKQYEKKHGGK